MEVRLLGPLDVRIGDVGVPLGGPKQRIVLAALALEPGKVVSVDGLLEAGWEDALPANPTNALQYQVAQLRKTLGDGAEGRPRIHTVPPGYRLDDEVTTDVARFDDLLARARAAFDSGDDRMAGSLVDQAVAMWRGPALSEFRHLDFAQGVAARLDTERLAAIELRVDVELRAGRLDNAIASLRELTTDHPTREGLWTRLALALYRSGRQPDALRTLHRARRELAGIGLDTSDEVADMESRILGRDPTLLPETVPAPNNLPVPVTQLFGRDADTERVVELLATRRLVTLVGPGGVGKTRLALAVAHRLVGSAGRAVWFVPLDSLDDEGLLAAEIGRVTELRENPGKRLIDHLVDHLDATTALLVLDNCEHLAGAVASLVGELVSRCAELTVLTTSQVVLGVVGEAVFDVGPLATPGSTASIYDPIADIDAVALFCERARSAGAATEVWGDDELAAVANVVAALDGLPLAIELAAARTRSMGLAEIARGLDNRFELLDSGPRTAPDRQRSLRNAVAWSLDLLDDRQRSFVNRLAVLVGEFDARAAAAVTGVPVKTIRDDLADLVDRSLLLRRPDVAGAARFALLESLRRHGLEAMSAGELAQARRGQLDYAVEFCRVANDGLRGPDQVRWLGEFDATYENVRSALLWAVDVREQEEAVAITHSLGHYWDWRGLLSEAARLTGRVIDISTFVVPRLAAVRAWLAYTAFEFGDLDDARRMSAMSVDDAEQLDDPVDLASALSVAVLLSRTAGDFETARSQASRLVAAANEADDPWLVAWADSALATVQLAAGDVEEAAELAAVAVQRFAELGDERGEGWGRLALAQIELVRGDPAKAGADARAALDSARRVRDERSVLGALEVIAEAALAGGDAELAARAWGGAQPLRAARGIAGSVTGLFEPDDFDGALRTTLGDDAFETHYRSARSNASATLDAIVAGG